MNLLALTHSRLIFINPPSRTPHDLIQLMSGALAERGLLNDREAFIRSVLHRESEGPTALGEALAVPHGKSDAVTRSAFCVAVFNDPIMWPGLEGDEAVRIVFLLAIPLAETGSTHMQLLTSLTSSLTDDKFRNTLLSAHSSEEVLAVLNNEDAPAKPSAESAGHPLIPILLGLIAAVAFCYAGWRWIAGTV